MPSDVMKSESLLILRLYARRAWWFLYHFKVLILKWGTWICWASSSGVNSTSLFKGTLDLSVSLKWGRILLSKQIWVQQQSTQTWWKRVWLHATYRPLFCSTAFCILYASLKLKVKLQCYKWEVGLVWFNQQIWNYFIFAPDSVGREVNAASDLCSLSNTRPRLKSTGANFSA